MLRLSGASLGLSLIPSRLANEAMKSIWLTNAFETLGLIFLGQRIIKGTRVPPS